MPSRLGIDIGEAGADFLLLDEDTGATRSLKLSDTGDGLDQTIGRGVRAVSGLAAIQPGEISAVVCGVGAVTADMRVGLIVTRGFDHVLHLGRGRSGGTAPSVTLDLTEGVAERMSADGNTITQLEESSALRSVNRLLQAGARALAVCLVNAHANPEHELRLGKIIADMDADIPVFLSHQVAPEAGEYERALATVMSAGQSPGVRRRLEMVRAGLKAAEISPRLYVAGADGSRNGADADGPANLAGASRAGAAGAAARIAAAAGVQDALVLDLGGGAANAALVRGGQPRISGLTGVGPDMVPLTSVDVRQIADGSRSVASAPFEGAISLGPPGRGAGPTVADANIVLGRIPAARGTDWAAAAEDAVAAFANLTGLDRHRAAEGIVGIFEERLAGALRLTAVAKGEDPERMGLVVCGGAGPMHGCAIGTLTGSTPVLVPRDAGSLAALGFATAGRSRQFAQGVGRTLDRLSAHDLSDIIAGLKSRADAWLAAEGMTGDVTYRADLRIFRGHFQVSTSVDPQALAEPGGLSALADRMDEAHRRRFGLAPEGGVEIVALRANAGGSAARTYLQQARPGGPDPRAALTDQVQAWFDGAFVTTSVFDRVRLQAGNRIAGPALVTEADTTTVIAPGHAGQIDGHLNILIRRDGRGA